jgi:hypothetical protein
MRERQHPVSSRRSRGSLRWLAGAGGAWASLLVGTTAGHASPWPTPGAFDPAGTVLWSAECQGKGGRGAPPPSTAPPGQPGASTAPPGTVPDLTQFTLEQLLGYEIGGGVSLQTAVAGAHTHPAGQWMLMQNYMLMGGVGNLNGTRLVPVPEILAQFQTTPISMTMAEQMWELMHAPSDNLTIMAMIPYRHMHMDHVDRAGGRFIGDTHGTGDLMLSGIYNVAGSIRKPGTRVLLNGGFTIPTGSIDEKNDEGKQFEYMMQLGSGTYDFYPGVTVLNTGKKWSWGAQQLSVVRTGINSHHYRFGNDYLLTAWSEYNVNEAVAASLRLAGHHNGNIIGRDPLLNPRREPTRDPNNYAGTRLDLIGGINLFAPKGKLKGARVSLEGGLPIYQSLAGPQPKYDWLVNVNASYSFGEHKRHQQQAGQPGMVPSTPGKSGGGRGKGS